MIFTQVYLTGEIALLDVAFPIASFSDGKGGYYTPNQKEAATPNMHIRKTYDGTQFVVGLDIDFLEDEFDTLNAALGTDYEYSFVSIEKMRKIVKFPEWLNGYKEGEEPKKPNKGTKTKKKYFTDIMKSKAAAKMIPETKTKV